MTAAHCGQVGSQWAIPHPTTANSYYYYGRAVNRDEWTDSLVIDSTTSYPYVYTSTWNSDGYNQVNGLRVPVVGTEICFSGSYSGAVCGNIGTSTEREERVGMPDGSVQKVYGFWTTQNNGVPSAGNGDSGGPGYVLSYTGTGYKRYAATIISAITAASTRCTGVPGEDPYRMCSTQVLSTSMSRALGTTGWSLQTINP